MTKLHELYDSCGQSPWLDNIKRSYLTTGKLADLVAAGVRGLTSNPTIFAKAIESSTDYDAQFTSLIGESSVEDAYWQMVVDDISSAADILAPIYDRSARADGFVSAEVGPHLAHDSEATLAEARKLHDRISKPNLLVKIPATPEGVPAISQALSEGISINVTLIFSLQRYEEVIDAHMAGLEELAHGDRADRLGQVASVASFFVSRVDTEVDARLDALATEATPSAAAEITSLKGKAAVAQAKLAYQLFRDKVSTQRWRSLEAKGAHLQRPLWASTSTKNPNYSDLLYVNSLVGPDTVNTMPDQTLSAFEDHGSVRSTIGDGLSEARAHLLRLAEVGVEMDDVTRVLEDEGVASFTKSFDELIQSLQDKANELGHSKGAGL